MGFCGDGEVPSFCFVVPFGEQVFGCEDGDGLVEVLGDGECFVSFSEAGIVGDEDARVMVEGIEAALQGEVL